MSEQRGYVAVPGSGYGVTDEVWRELQPEAARAAALERRAVLVVVFLVAGLVLAAAGTQWSGLLSPRLSGGDNSGGDFDPTTRRVTFQFDLHNEGVTSADVVGWKSRLDGVVAESARPSEVRLAGRTQQRVSVTFRVTDCGLAVPASRLSLRDDPSDPSGVDAQVRRWWGAVGVTVNPPGGIADLVLSACGVDPTSEGP